MFKKLLASLPATLLATTALAQPIYETANELRAAPTPTADSRHRAAEYPADVGEPIYFTANRLRAANRGAVVDKADEYPVYSGQPIYVIANRLRSGS